MPTFSIIVPVYKTEKFLNKCVSSILQQSYRDFELILVDDGSPDYCPQICDDYQKKDSRIKVLHKTNGGVSSARNLGINAAIGEYIWFVDSDDYIEPFALQQLYDIQSKQKADVYVFNNSFLCEEKLDDINDFFEKYYFTYILGFESWNKLYKSNIIRSYDLQFDVQETIGEDLLFNINYYKAIFTEKGGKIVSLGQNCYQYTNRENSAMNTMSKEKINNQLRLFEKIKESLFEVLSEESLIYLFFMHLISGIAQSLSGGLTSSEFSRIDFSQYSYWIENFVKIENRFFENENSSVLGKMRIRLFVKLMKKGNYRLAGKVVGLKWTSH